MEARRGDVAASLAEGVYEVYRLCIRLLRFRRVRERPSPFLLPFFFFCRGFGREWVDDSKGMGLGSERDPMAVAHGEGPLGLFGIAGPVLEAGFSGSA